VVSFAVEALAGVAESGVLELAAAVRDRAWYEECNLIYCPQTAAKRRTSFSNRYNKTSMLGNQEPSLSLKYIFGMKPDLCQAQYIDEHRVIYPAGHSIVVFNTEDRTQSFLPGLEGSFGISTFELSLSRRYLAVAEKAERAIATIYDLHTMKRKKTLTSTDCMSNEFVSMSFLPEQESKFMITLSGEPDWMLIYW
jgi:hypothetical protein